MLLCIFLGEKPGHCPKAPLLFLDCSSLVSVSPPFPDEQLFELALWNSGTVMEAEAYSLKARNGGHRKACVSRSPTGSGSISFWARGTEFRYEADHLQMNAGQRDSFLLILEVEMVP